MGRKSTHGTRHFLYLLTSLFIIGCTVKDGGDTDEIVAVVNGVSISSRDLIHRFELAPLIGHDRLEEKHERVLNIMIDEMVVSQWVNQEGVVLPSAYHEAIEFITQQASIRELFRLYFESLPAADSGQIFQAYTKLNMELSIQTIFTESPGISKIWREATNNGQAFTELLAGSSDNPAIHIGQSTFHWGDGKVPEKIEAIAYGMEIDEVSDVVPVNRGFVIIKLIGIEKELVLSESSYSGKWRAAQKQLRIRQEFREARKYLAKIMKNINITQRAAGFQEVSRYLEKYLRDKPDQSVVEVTGRTDETPFLPEYDLAMPVVETPDFIWTGDDVLILLRKYNFHTPVNDPDAFRHNLTGFLKGAVRDHYLGERAKRLNIDSDERVTSDIRQWSRHFQFRVGIRAMSESDTTSTVADKIADLRESAAILVHKDILEKIEFTKITMQAYWNSDIASFLAVPPLIEIQ